MKRKEKLVTIAGLVALAIIDYLINKNIDGVIATIAAFLLAKERKKKKKH